MRPSRRPLRGLLRVRTVLNPINGLPHAEERSESASRSTRRHQCSLSCSRCVLRRYQQLAGWIVQCKLMGKGQGSARPSTRNGTGLRGLSWMPGPRPGKTVIGCNRNGASAQLTTGLDLAWTESCIWTDQHKSNACEAVRLKGAWLLGWSYQMGFNPDRMTVTLTVREFEFGLSPAVTSEGDGVSDNSLYGRLIFFGQSMQQRRWCILKNDQNFRVSTWA